MNAAAPPLFTLDALHHTYANGQRGLADCSLQIARGSRTVLLGANGCGKTTLLLHLNGLLHASSGRLLVDGAPLAHDRASLDALRRRVGLVFQNPERQVFSASVAEDAAIGDEDEFHPRPARFYRERLRRLGFMQIGSHGWLSPALARHATALEHA